MSAPPNPSQRQASSSSPCRRCQQSAREVSALQARIAELEAQLAEARQTNRRLAEELEQAQEDLTLCRRKLFSSSSERIVLDAQPEMESPSVADSNLDDNSPGADADLEAASSSCEPSGASKGSSADEGTFAEEASSPTEAKECCEDCNDKNSNQSQGTLSREPKQRKVRDFGWNKLPEQLPRDEQPHDLPEEERVCDLCGDTRSARNGITGACPVLCSLVITYHLGGIMGGKLKSNSAG